jgi:thiol-disulfide isomerase/thioredoxin
VNEEDLPPAPEAEAMAPAGTASSRASVSTRRSSSPGDAWRSGKRDRDRVEPGNPTEPPSESEVAPKPAGPAEPEVAPVDHEAKGTGAPVGEAPNLPDDGENPLPPALEPVPEKAASAGPEPVPEREPSPSGAALPRLAAGSLDPDLARLYESSPTTRQPAASSPFESPTSPTASRTVSPPEDSAPGALVVVPETFGPVVVHPSDPFAGTRPAADDPTAARSEPRTRPALFGSSKPARDPAASPVAATAPKPATLPARDAGGDRQRPTWGQVVATASSPEDPAVTEVADRKPIDPSANKGAARRALAVRPVEPDRAPKAIKVSNTRPECEYDDRLRRIIDFRLPDLDGKPVRFQEIDSDLVLIDFWGTWCQPCLRSIPHLVELQERMGKRLTIVGIACESDAPQASSAKVSETVRRLKVNYPVLLSRNDGSCPLQEALHIQAFPTMILVDRQGRVLWRDQGATPATLARLDRIITSTPRADETRRY